MLEGEEDVEVEETTNLIKAKDEDNGEITLHALKGVANSKIIKVEWEVQNYKLMVLIDSKSTHSFLDEITTKRLNCKLTSIHSLLVKWKMVTKS